MSRLVIPLLLLLLLAAPVSAAYYVNKGGSLYKVRYSVYSNGTDALIRVEVDNYGITCGMMDCWAEVYDVYSYLLFFNGSRLYLLKFTPVLLSVLPPYAPRNVSWVYFNGVKYAKGWYVNVSVFAYSAEAHDGSKLNYVLRLDTKRFCAEKTNVNWSQIKGSTLTDEIRDWKIEIPKEFRARLVFINNTWVRVSNETAAWIPPSADFYLIANSSIVNQSYYRYLFLKRRPIIVNWTQFPVYFLLKKDGQVRNVTLLYINTTNSINGFWFPESIKIVNVTSCKLLANETPTTATNPKGHQNKSICGPGVIVALALLPIMRERREGKEI